MCVLYECCGQSEKAFGRHAPKTLEGLRPQSRSLLPISINIDGAVAAAVNFVGLHGTLLSAFGRMDAPLRALKSLSRACFVLEEVLISL